MLLAELTAHFDRAKELHGLARLALNFDPRMTVELIKDARAVLGEFCDKEGNLL